MLYSFHCMAPNLALGHHFTEFGSNFTIIDDADRLADHRRDCSHQSHANLDAAEIGPAEKVEIDAAAAAPSMFTFGAGS